MTKFYNYNSNYFKRYQIYKTRNYNGLLLIQQIFHQQLTKLIVDKELVIRLGRNARCNFEQKYLSRKCLKIAENVYYE